MVVAAYWGTVFGMAAMTRALVAIPFLDKGKRLAMAIFWLVLVVGMVRNFFAEAS